MVDFIIHTLALEFPTSTFLRHSIISSNSWLPNSKSIPGYLVSGHWFTGQMNQLSNAFSLLAVDDSGEQEQIVTVDGREKKKEFTSAELAQSSLENGPEQDSDVVSREFRLPLVWIDLEMTGLDIEVDRILEIACIITNGSLTKSIEGPDIVIHREKECLDKMGEWCQEHHAASGLTDKVIRSSVTEREAEKQVVEFVKKHVGTSTPLLAGNSVYVDLLFLKKYMPELAGLFSHVLVDVSSIKALCMRWYPRDNKKAPRKENKHRAMDDIKESIAELKYFKATIFKPSKYKN